MARRTETKKTGKADDQTDVLAAQPQLQSPRAEFRLLIRQRILDAGRHCFMDKGFSATTMEDIAKRSRIGRTAIYQHFQNKSQIMNVVIEEDERLFLQSFVTAMPVDFDQLDSVRQGVQTMLALYRKESALMRVMNEAAYLDSTVSDRLESNFQSYLHAIVDRASQHSADPGTPDAQLLVRSWICISAMDSIFQRLLDPRWNLDEKLAVDEITALWSTLVGGVQKQHAHPAVDAANPRTAPVKRKTAGKG